MQTEAQTDMQTEAQTDMQTEAQTDRQRHRYRVLRRLQTIQHNLCQHCVQWKVKPSYAEDYAAMSTNKTHRPQCTATVESILDESVLLQHASSP